MMGAVIGIALGFLIGVSCRWFDLPLPAPPKIVGALLVVFMTLGFVGTDYLLLDVPSGACERDPGHISQTWPIGHMGLSNFTARISDVVIRIKLDEDDLTRSVVAATIDRTDFGPDYLSGPILGDDVEILVRAGFLQQ